MRKILYLTDSHIGADTTAWCQQPCCPHLLPDLWNDLREFVAANPLDLVLHGGDLTHHGTVDEQREAVRIAVGLGVPFRLCLGNHDLAREGALESWLSLGHELFGERSTPSGDFAVDLGSAILLVATNTWRDSDQPWFWSLEEALSGPVLADRQYMWLKEQLAAHRNKPAILAMHETLYPLPPRLTGLEQPTHEPSGFDVARTRGFVEEHDQIRLVLSGHCHATCRTYDNGCVHLTTGAFFEPPFQVRILTVDRNGIDVETVCPSAVAKYNPPIDEGKTWTSGQPVDRRVRMNF
ncbi:MAG: hypothetical protein GXY33_10840 [Phycisphaerae bacterium]|nr:hypothetical protein [Phycisphaerae bacterium]